MRDGAAIWVVFVTAPAKEASALSKSLVEEGLVACVNINETIRSIYAWEGKICEDNESLLVMKTVADKFNELQQRIQSLHSYDTPEIIAVPAAAVSNDYAKWVRDVVGEGDSK
ncbi:MAG: divalent-cation tolerance protein CutA [Myxococcota bacterium]|nr:divalent-cation tolerance protein CutA [Myxococcota bacterium]